MRHDAEGQLKIFDFGLAKLDTNPGTKVLYFTDSFTASESFKKNHAGLHTFDYPLDVYAFGCVAIWLLNDGSLFSEMSGVTPSFPSHFNFLNLPVKVDSPTANLLHRCLSADPNDRPTMLECKRHLSAELLRNQHKMALTSKTGQVILDVAKPKGTVSGNGASIAVIYDGVLFSVAGVTGNVAINNAPAFVGQILTGSTVIVLRGTGGLPLSVTCDVSHPEVTL